MSDSSVVERVVRRDRRVVILALTGVIVLSWGYLLAGAGLGSHATEAMPGPVERMAWSPSYAILILVMWWVMMLAMMLPSATPMILLFASVNRRAAGRGAPHVGTTVFAAGYALAWGSFSLAAVALQWGLERSGVLPSVMATTSGLVGGGLLIAAGLYQLSPLKRRCLEHCRSPLVFLSHRWKPGRSGALRMGLDHGVYCLGCCWVLMGLLFYGGVMNLYWIVGLALYVLVEKTAPAGPALARALGLFLVGWGGLVLFVGGQ